MVKIWTKPFRRTVTWNRKCRYRNYCRSDRKVDIDYTYDGDLEGRALYITADTSLGASGGQTWGQRIDVVNTGGNNKPRGLEINVDVGGAGNPSEVDGIVIDVDAAGTGSVGTIRGLYLTGIGVDAGKTATNVYGIYVSDLDDTGTILTNQFAFYQAGANDKNYFAGSIQSDSQIYSSIQAASTPTTAQTIDWNDGNVAIVDLGSATGNVTLTLNNPKAGASYFIKIIQGPNLVDITFPSTVKFAGETAPYTLDVTATDNAIDAVALTCISDSGTVEYLANVSQNYG